VTNVLIILAVACCFFSAGTVFGAIMAMPRESGDE